jgi:hypothetical protein
MKVGGREVVGTGTIVTHFGDSVVELTYENLVFRLTFLTNTQTSELASIEAEVLDDRLDLRLSHFDSAVGISWYGNVATVSGKTLYLSLIVHAIGEGENITRAIGFTFTTEVI